MIRKIAQTGSRMLGAIGIEDAILDRGSAGCSSASLRVGVHRDAERGRERAGDRQRGQPLLPRSTAKPSRYQPRPTGSTNRISSVM